MLATSFKRMFLKTGNMAPMQFAFGGHLNSSPMLTHLYIRQWHTDAKLNFKSFAEPKIPIPPKVSLITADFNIIVLISNFGTERARCQDVRSLKRQNPLLVQKAEWVRQAHQKAALHWRHDHHREVWQEGRTHHQRTAGRGQEQIHHWWTQPRLLIHPEGICRRWLP